jgi:ribosome-binding protein aMBF1 (putative translation factor)
MNDPNRSRIKDWPAHLKAFRAKHKLTQRQLADMLPSSVRVIEDIKQGEYAPRPYLKRALRDLARGLFQFGKRTG